MADLSDSEFLRHSIIAGPDASHPIPERTRAASQDVDAAQARARVAQVRPDAAKAKARADAVSKAKKLSDNLAEELARRPPRCRLVSLERSAADELVLSDVVLDECKFAGANGLDKMRIGADCSFRRTRDRSSTDAFTQRRVVTGRRLIAEEIAWCRKEHTRRADRHTNKHFDQQNRSETDQPNQPADQKKEPEQAPASTLLAAYIAGIYRDLRKGLEDAKNEPEAADFYYGEMEMRRLAGRARGDGSDEGRQRASSIMERILLYGYWAVSGYGLRAWRAAVLFSHLGLATQTPPDRIASINPKDGAVTYVHANPPAPGFLTALNFSARESVSLLHADSASVKSQGAGTLVDFVLRLAGPVLLAFIVLALRARTKR